MSDHHDDNGIKYEFKHDTDNLTIFSLLVFSIAGVALVMAGTMLWMQTAKQGISDDQAEMPYESFEALHAEEDKHLTKLDDAKKQVIGDYSK